MMQLRTMQVSSLMESDFEKISIQSLKELHFDGDIHKYTPY